MDEANISSLQEELRAIDEQISVLNTQIQSLCWRRTPEGDRRRTSAQEDRRRASTKLEAIVPDAPRLDAPRNEQRAGNDRRAPTAVRIAVLREQLASALQRYLALQSLAHFNEQGLSR